MGLIAPLTTRGRFGKLPTAAAARHGFTSTGYRAGAGIAATVLNSTPAIVGNGGVTLGRALGNTTYDNCCAAALGWHKLFITSATGAPMLFLPEGGNPCTTDSPWGTAVPPTPGPSSAVPANAAGVVSWAQANSVLGYTTIANTLGRLAAFGTWPAGGFVDANGAHHPILTYGPIAATNQTQIASALQYFKTVIVGLSGDGMLSQWSGGASFISGLTVNRDDNHAFCVCDCGPAATLAAQYSISVPAGISPTAFSLAGISWGSFLVLDWASLLNVVTEAWVVIGDPDRGDAAVFNPLSQAYYRSVIGTNGPYAAAALCSYRK